MFMNTLKGMLMAMAVFLLFDSCTGSGKTTGSKSTATRGLKD
jgi:hypothetical protein